MSDQFSLPRNEISTASRRQFLGGALGAAAAVPLLGPVAGLASAAEASKRKLKIGIVGCGGRGSWIAPLFREHGGYELHAVSDYFPEMSEKLGETMGVDKSRRFSGLSGYKKIIQSGVDALILQTPPRFFVEHAAAAVDAGVHVYMAKPVAVDVPGCLRVKSLAQQATQKKQVFFIDLQFPTDPLNIQIAERIRSGEIGKIAKIVTYGIWGGHFDAPKTATVESRLKNNVWENDIALSGGYISIYDIHCIDEALWLVGQRPIAAMGASSICRANANGDAADVNSVVYDYADGLIHENCGVGLPNAFGIAKDSPSEISVRVYGQIGNATLSYMGTAGIHVRRKAPFSAPVVGLYGDGAKRNIAAFYQAVATGDYENATVARPVDSTLTCILGREAAARRTRLTMDELIKENKSVELDLSGLQA